MENKIEQINLDGDEEIVNPLRDWLTINLPRLTFGPKTRLTELFLQPQRRNLRDFWKAGSHADIPVYRHGKLISIVEPGGNHHFKDSIQIHRDKKKDKICKDNGVTCLRIANSVLNYLDKKQTKRLFKKYFYGGQNGKRS